MTKSSSENIAAENLKRQDFNYYLPKYSSRVGKETKVKILFPRYIFVSIELQWHCVMNTKGITRLILTNENKPAKIADRIIDNFKAREDNKGLITLPSPPKFSQGEKVRVVNGPFCDRLGMYDGMRPDERARVLIELLGQSVPIELDERDLASVVTNAVAVESRG
jgi:transcriptional antiterminator RfaH